MCKLCRLKRISIQSLVIIVRNAGYKQQERPQQSLRASFVSSYPYFFSINPESGRS